MKVKDLINRMKNGAAHLYLIDSDDGIVYLKTIWYNEIPSQFLDYEVDTIEIRDYEIRLGVHHE